MIGAIVFVLLLLSAYFIFPIQIWWKNQKVLKMGWTEQDGEQT
jgi:hypothetical protein